MNLKKYDYWASDSFLDFEFYSEGPKGSIKKILGFTLVTLPAFAYYNLGFGDWNESKKKIDDSVVSNNGDTERVLATVASAIVDFTNHYPGVIVYAEGSTRSRTRLYQMAINKYWQEIESIFRVYGLDDSGGFQPFEYGKNYKAFVAIRKNH